MRKINDKARKRLKRKASIRKKISGTAERPRLSVYKSNRYTYVQAIDDVKGVTVATASTLDKSLKSALKTGGNIDAAKAEEARQQAAARLRQKLSAEQVAAVNAALARSLAQLRVKRRQLK
jgi:ribosomal protein L18